MRKPRSGRARFRSSKWEPIVYCALSLAGVAAAVLLVIFVLIPFVTDLFAPLPTVRYTPSSFKESVEVETKPEIQEEDLSSLQNEARINYNTINDPYLFGDSIVFSTASVKNGVSVYDTIIVHNIETQKDKRISVTVKYENLIKFVMNDRYIVWCDAASDNGGRICGYDRETGSQFAIKDYVFAAPEITMSGDIICFMQQAGDDLDRLYLFDLKTRESLTYKVFSGLGAKPTAADISGDTIVYAIPSEDKGYDIISADISTGKEQVIPTGKDVYEPKTNGGDIAFLSGAGAPTDLYLMDGQTAILVDSGVANFDMSDAGIVYTKDEAVYLYKKDEKRSIRINSSITRAYLAETNGENICWYDITGGYGGTDVVKYAKMEG